MATGVFGIRTFGNCLISERSYYGAGVVGVVGVKKMSHKRSSVTMYYHCSAFWTFILSRVLHFSKELPKKGFRGNIRFSPSSTSLRLRSRTTMISGYHNPRNNDTSAFGAVGYPSCNSLLILDATVKNSISSCNAGSWKKLRLIQLL